MRVIPAPAASNWCCRRSIGPTLSVVPCRGRAHAADRTVLSPPPASGSLHPPRTPRPPISYKWREGSRLVYELNNHVLQESETPFGNTGSEVEVRSVQSLSVERVRRGDGTIRATTESVRLTGDLGPGGSISFDSENPRDRRRVSDPNIAPFVFLLGKSYTMTLTPAGEVVRLDEYAQHLNELLASQRDPAVAQARALDEQSIFRASLEQMYASSRARWMWGVLGVRSTQTIGVQRGHREPQVHLRGSVHGGWTLRSSPLGAPRRWGRAACPACGSITESSIQGRSPSASIWASSWR